jgi:hypothetical protein
MPPFVVITQTVTFETIKNIQVEPIVVHIFLITQGSIDLLRNATQQRRTILLAIVWTS